MIRVDIGPLYTLEYSLAKLQMELTYSEDPILRTFNCKKELDWGSGFRSAKVGTPFASPTRKAKARALG
jgi:hypothetical protein